MTIEPPPPAPVERPNGRVTIEWNPNTGAIAYNAERMSPVEELWLLVYVQHMRLNQQKCGMEPGRVIPASTPLRAPRA